MGQQGKQLGQVRPSGTVAVPIYNMLPGVSVRAVGLMVSNTTGSVTTFGFYHDDDGRVFDQSTALAHDTPIQANESVFFEGQFMGDNLNGSFGVASGTADAICFTLYGYEVT